MKRTIFILLAAVTAMIGCKRDPASTPPSTEQLVIAADIFGATRASHSQSAFAAGNEASVWITASRASAVQPLSASGNFADNVRYAYDAATSTFVNQEDRITFPDPASKLGLYSLYPYSRSVALVDQAGVVSCSHTVLADQTLQANFIKSDLMTATRGTNGVSVADMETPAPMTYFHRMAKFDITVVAPLTYGDAPLTDIVSVKLLGLKSTAKVVIADPAYPDNEIDFNPNTAMPAAAYGSPTVDITMNMAQQNANDATAKTQTRTYEAIVAPQSLAVNARVIEITAKYGATEIVFPYVIGAQPIPLVAGKSNTLVLNLLKPYPIQIGNVTLLPWKTDSFNGNMDYALVDNQFVTQADKVVAGCTTAKVMLKDDPKIYTVAIKYDAGTKKYSFGFDGTNNTEPADYPYAIVNIDFYTNAVKTASYPCSQPMNARDAVAAPPTVLAIGLDYTTQPANSYISYPGKVLAFDARKKAVSVNGAATNVIPTDVSSADIAPASVKVVWQTAANHGSGIPEPNPSDMVIQYVAYDKAAGTCVVQPHPTGTGNALVAAYAADGTTILWSWHIWVTQGEVKADVNPGNDANGAGKFLMDRNLGALAATTTQPAAADAYKYFGLLWQWGRKEPFTGQGIGEAYDTYTKIYKADATPYDDVLGGFTYNDGAAAKMMECIKNPTTHYRASDNGLISGNPATWSETGSNKSIYDPCPYGYRVPKDGTWGDFPVLEPWDFGDIASGGVWQSTWWPTSGSRFYNSANFSDVTFGGYYWSSSSAGGINSYNLVFTCEEYTDPACTTYSSGSYSLRCVQE